MLINRSQQFTNNMPEHKPHHFDDLYTQFLQLVPLGFEKNYPKNIFIPIIEHLSALGLRQRYEQTVGTRELYESKNVVSLAVIHKLISQKWFLNKVDKGMLVKAVCNKIMVNSKIKKKIFHLKIAQAIINSNFESEKEFKQFVGRQIGLLSAKNIENDEMLFFPNATLYLLHLMVKNLIQNLEPQPFTDDFYKYSFENRMRDDCSESSENLKTHSTSKVQYRYYVKQIIKLFNDGRYSKNQLTRAHSNLSAIIKKREEEFQEKYNLEKGIPNWSIFIHEIAEKCLYAKQKGFKVTNNLLNEWIDQFKMNSFKIQQTDIEKIQEQGQDIKQEDQSYELILKHISKQFQPIIIMPLKQSLIEHEIRSIFSL